jgi:hypothetical protein
MCVAIIQEPSSRDASARRLAEQGLVERNGQRPRHPTISLAKNANMRKITGQVLAPSKALAVAAGEEREPVCLYNFASAFLSSTRNRGHFVRRILNDRFAVQPVRLT